MLDLGSWSDNRMAWFIYYVATVFFSILIMNFITTLMFEPFENTRDRKNAYNYQNKLELIHQCLDLVDIRGQFRG